MIVRGERQTRNLCRAHDGHNPPSPSPAFRKAAGPRLSGHTVHQGSRKAQRHRNIPTVLPISTGKVFLWGRAHMEPLNSALTPERRILSRASRPACGRASRPVRSVAPFPEPGAIRPKTIFPHGFHKKRMGKYENGAVKRSQRLLTRQTSSLSSRSSRSTSTVSAREVLTLRPT